MKVIVLGKHIQGLISAALLAKSGAKVTIVDFPNGDYNIFNEGHKTGPVTHLPFSLPNHIITELDLETHGLKTMATLDNPFKKLPFYDGLKQLLSMFTSLENSRPSYKEKSWRDTWGTFEIARILSEYDGDTQKLFAKSTKLSLVNLLDATKLSDSDKAEIITICTLGSKTDPASNGSASAILPAMKQYEMTDSVSFQGSLHNLASALKQSAMSHNATIIDEQVIEKINMDGDKIQSITLSGGDEIIADHYIIDHDPVLFFKNYLNDYSVPPSFKNRVIDKQNLKESIHLKIVLVDNTIDINAHEIFAPSANFIASARSEMKENGGSQYPVLSIVNITKDSPSLSPDNAIILDVIAQYFDPTLEENTDAAKIAAVKQSLEKQYEGITDKISHISITPISTQFGQPNFIGTMPLLHLFKIFFGHHSLGYDMPINNLLFCGYGHGTSSHYHVHDGGSRVALLLQSF